MGMAEMPRAVCLCTGPRGDRVHGYVREGPVSAAYSRAEWLTGDRPRTDSSNFAAATKRMKRPDSTLGSKGTPTRWIVDTHQTAALASPVSSFHHEDKDKGPSSVAEYVASQEVSNVTLARRVGSLPRGRLIITIFQSQMLLRQPGGGRSHQGPCSVLLRIICMDIVCS